MWSMHIYIIPTFMLLDMAKWYSSLKKKKQNTLSREPELILFHLSEIGLSIHTIRKCYL